jgi:hypothetical protein
MHSRAIATTLERATYILLSGNEFHLQNASFRSIFVRQPGTRVRKERTPGCARRGRGKPGPYENWRQMQHFPRPFAKAQGKQGRQGEP